MSKISQIVQKGDPRWLEDETTLWRYVSLETLFSYLNGNIFLPSIAKLRKVDPFEGEYPDGYTVGFATAFRNRYATNAPLLKWNHDRLCSADEKSQIGEDDRQSDRAASIFARHYRDFRRKTRFASCWFKSEGESAAMWSTYGKGGAAVAAEVGRLKQALDGTGRDFRFGQMRYIPSHETPLLDRRSGPSNDGEFLLRPDFLKRIEYKHEQEVRFITAGPKREDSEGILLRGLRPSDWITKVRLWPGLTAAEEETLKAAIHHFVPQLDCCCSDLLGRNWPGEDVFGELMEEVKGKEDTEWRSGSDGIPPEMKEI